MKTIDKVVMALGNESIWKIFLKNPFSSIKIWSGWNFSRTSFIEYKKAHTIQQKFFRLHEIVQPTRRPNHNVNLRWQRKKDDSSDFMKLKMIRFHYY